MPQDMKTVELESTTTVTGDLIRIGDLITAYRKGFHIVTRITQWIFNGQVYGGEHNQIVHYRQYCDEYGNLSKHAKVEHDCGKCYCAPAAKRIKELRKQADALEAAIKQR